jgi:TRAP-type C4-dicarboxylate transport system permease small subunit
VLVWGGGVLTLRTFASVQVLPTFALSQGWIYLSVPLSGVVTIYYAIDDLIRILREGPEAVRLGSGTDLMT